MALGSRKLFCRKPKASKAPVRLENNRKVSSSMADFQRKYREAKKKEEQKSE